MIWPFSKTVNICKHKFKLADLRLTNIPELERPKSRSYEEWSNYFDKLQTHKSITHRVCWPCCVCNKEFYAHCGLDISPKHGPIIQ